MHSRLIQCHHGQLKIGTWDLSQGIGVQHRHVKSLVERNTEHMGEHLSKQKRPTKKKGGQIEEYLLNEEQTRVLLALMINHPNMNMGLHTCIFRSFDSELHFFKTLEEFLQDIEEIKEFISI